MGRIFKHRYNQRRILIRAAASILVHATFVTHDHQSSYVHDPMQLLFLLVIGLDRDVSAQSQSFVLTLYTLIAFLLLEADQPRVRVTPSVSIRHRATFGRFGSEECISLFRFRPQDLPRLKATLRIPDQIRAGHGVDSGWVFSGQEGLLLLLRRLAYPCRWEDLVPIFGLYIEEMSTLFSWMISHVYENFHYLLESLARWKPLFPSFAEACAEMGSPANLGVFGFVDGTLRQIDRPSARNGHGNMQRAAYSGHKKKHGLKFESVSFPNGITAWLKGPYEGRRHDAFIIRTSGLLEHIEDVVTDATATFGIPLAIYGDRAYPLRPFLQTNYKGRRENLTNEQLAYNELMSGLRESVEWQFNKTVEYFAFIDFHKNQKIFLQPVGKYYIVATILANCHTCLFGSITSSYFGCMPPTIEYYLEFPTQ
jgi:hypothetical protein